MGGRQFLPFSWITFQSLIHLLSCVFDCALTLGFIADAPEEPLVLTAYGWSSSVSDVIAYTLLAADEKASHVRFLLVYPQWIASAVLLRRILSMY